MSRRWRDPKTMDVKSIQNELDKLAKEDGLINKALEAVRLAKLKNNIELMEVMSKIAEFEANSQSQKNAPQKATNKNTAVVSSASAASSSKNIDNPSIVNQKKLNLSVALNLNVDREEESEESD